MTEKTLHLVIMDALDRAPANADKKDLARAIVGNVRMLLQIESELQSGESAGGRVLKAPLPSEALIVDPASTTAQDRRPQKLVPMRPEESPTKSTSPSNWSIGMQPEDRAAAAKGRLEQITSAILNNAPQELTVVPDGFKDPIVLERDVVALNQQEMVRLMYKPKGSADAIQRNVGSTDGLFAGAGTREHTINYSNQISAEAHVDDADTLDVAGMVDKLISTAKKAYARRQPIESVAPQSPKGFASMGEV